MSHPIDVGSVLGGRYKVTATVLTSHDQDLVLDGVDQVLNRPVSILVAGPGNADQVAKSAREVATGERPGNVQILDLGVSENTTYLITNHSSAPDLLDLVVATHQPYVEPFFTDTLGSEIFGQARSNEPEPYDGLYDDEVDADYITYDDDGQPTTRPAEADASGRGAETGGRRAPVVPPMPPSRPASSSGSGIAAKLAAAAAGAGAAAAAAAAAVKGGPDKAVQGPASAERTSADDVSRRSPGAAAASDVGAVPGESTAHDAEQRPATQAFDAAAASAAQAGTPPTSAVPATSAGAAEKPKVSLWSEEDYGFASSPTDAAHGNAAHGNAAQGNAAQGGGAGGRGRTAAPFPASPPSSTDFEEEEYYDDEPEREPRSLRWLVGGILAAVLVVGLILAISNLGSIFPTGQPAASSPSTASQAQPSSGGPSASQSTAPVAGPPSIEGITRLGSFDFAGTYDKDLPRAFDGNAASYWSDMEFATEDWGGLASEVPLVVKLKAPSKVSSITLSQLGASGGSISVYTNDRPAMDGTKLVGTNSFTSPDLTMPLAEPVTAQYVIISIKTLPKLAAPKTRYGFGLRLAEIKVQ